MKGKFILLNPRDASTPMLGILLIVLGVGSFVATIFPFSSVDALPFVEISLLFALEAVTGFLIVRRASRVARERRTLITNSWYSFTCNVGVLFPFGIAHLIFFGHIWLTTDASTAHGMALAEVVLAGACLFDFVLVSLGILLLSKWEKNIHNLT